MKLNKIILDGMTCQDIPYVCPNCNFDMMDFSELIIGWGEYPLLVNLRSLQSISNIGMGFECPQCFTKSVCHISESLFNELKEGEVIL